MSLEIRRVPLDWDWPLNREWEGYDCPHKMIKCKSCHGDGGDGDGVCLKCDGDGEVWPSIRTKRAAEQWRRREPPKGPGWQLWNTVYSGAPISPVMENADALIDWMVNVYQPPYGDPITREQATAFTKTGWFPTMMVVDGKRYVGIEAAEVLAKEKP